MQLLAEAKFVRALFYFYLVNFYGDVPLLLSTDLKVNAISPKVSSAVIYQQIIKDLLEAKNDIRDDYLSSNAASISNERLRPNKATVKALLSKVYLYTQNWTSAESEATEIIEDRGTYQLETLQNTFLKDSREAIWQLQPTVLGKNTSDAESYVLLPGSDISTSGPNGGSRPVYLSNYIFEAFESGDARKLYWTDSVVVDNVVYPFSYKYKTWEANQPRTEYLIVFRLAEQYLIRAEARAHINKLTGVNSASSDLNVIRQRAGLKELSISAAEEILPAIYRERKVELFAELGNRWFDLKRTNLIDEVMNSVASSKGSNWSSYKALFPIPIYDITHNPALKGHQNPGYPEL
jgi:hypothetical protein